MKKIAVIQSNYIPWKGYFDIIHDVDQFIFYDDVQYTKNDWRNRNRIKTPQGIGWITIPVGKREGRKIFEVELQDPSWQSKHWTTLKQSYSKAPYYKLFKDYFEYIYLERQWVSLSELNQYLIKQISMELLGIQTVFSDSREYKPEGDRVSRLVDLIKKANGCFYLSGPAAKDYIDDNLFSEAQIKLAYKDYSGYPEYSQLFPPFEHAVSIIDVLFNCGPDTPFFIWGWRGNKEN